MSDVIEKIQRHTIRQLEPLITSCLSDSPRAGADAPPLRPAFRSLIDNFNSTINKKFDELDGAEHTAEPAIDFENLCLVQDDDLNTQVTIQSLVTHARRLHGVTLLRLHARLRAALPESQILEVDHPLDPEQLLNAFDRALKAAGLNAQDNAYYIERFNTCVLLCLEPLLKDANQILIDAGFLPNLKTTPRSYSHHRPAMGADDLPRSNSAPSTPGCGPYGEVDNPPAGATNNGAVSGVPFSAMQQLLHGNATNNTAALNQPAQPPNTFAAPTMIDHSALLNALSQLQTTSLLSTGSPTGLPASLMADNLAPMSRDIMSLVALLYDAMWQDNALPIPIKELISRTQITFIRIALTDVGLFEREDHPARRLLNEFADAGIGWTQENPLAEDPLYQMISTLVTRLLSEYDGDDAVLTSLLREFRQFRARETAGTHQLESRIMAAQNRAHQIEAIETLVSRKIDERIMGRELPELVSELLEGPLHGFMVKLLVKEGLTNPAWKQALSTVDVLIWSVQPKQQAQDAHRLELINPRLVKNLHKAFRIAQLSTDLSQAHIERLKQLQLETLPRNEPNAASGQDDDMGPAGFSQLEEDAPELLQVDQMEVGMWAEFHDLNGANLRCKLAARINAIDKLIFVNQRDIKVTEQNRMELAVGLHQGKVTLIQDGQLFSRALASVITSLRQAQDTSDAYAPAAEVH